MGANHGDSKLITQLEAIFFAPLIEEEAEGWQFDVMRAAGFLSSWIPLKEGRTQDRVL